MTDQRKRVLTLARVAPDADHKTRIAALRRAADEVREMAECCSIYSLSELEKVIADGERRHRRLSWGGTRGRLSAPVAVDYFLIRVLSAAAELLSQRSAKQLVRGLAGARTDYLIGFSIYSRYLDDFKGAGFTRSTLKKLAKLVDYCDDIAGNYPVK